ncbi:hypothetical protein AUG19_09245 [archaeon 13_1_20CM_2_54_9]|nr:MAG: hypothetical protein AUG19_09245 [archaeon 13_1_20CM_2_54_9]
MNPDTKDGRVTVRPAEARDKRVVLDFCRNTWRGGDYIPEVWDEWMSGPKGSLLVATIRGIPIGLGHCYFQTKDVLWLEGLRVDLAYRRRGIAGRLNCALTKHGRARGAVLSRLCTSIQNIASQRHAEKVGFRILQRFDRFDSSQPLTRKPAGVYQIRKYRTGLWRQIQRWPEFSEFRGLYSDGWTWYPITPRGLRNAAEYSRVLVTNSDGEISSLAIISTDKGRLTIGFFAGKGTQAEQIARYSRYRLAKGGFQRVRALIPHGSSLTEAFKAAGFKPTNSILVYQKILRPSREKNKDGRT